VVTSEEFLVSIPVEGIAIIGDGHIAAEFANIAASLSHGSLRHKLCV
jgi:hypothetical protein